MLNRLLTFLGFKPGVPGIEPLDPPLRDIARRLIAGDAPDGWQPLSSSAQARVARGEWCDQTVVLKVFLPRGRLERVKSLIRGSRGVRAARRGRDLCAEGFDAPQVLAHGWIGASEVIVMEAVAAPSLLRLLSHRLGTPLADRRDRWRLLKAFGSEVARLHAAGWLHGDLRLGNVLLRADHEQKPAFCLLDNESNRRSNAPAGRIDNLVQLNMIAPQYLSRGDRLRFLTGYVGEQGLKGAGARELAREVVADTHRRQLQRAARGGPKPRHWVGSSG